MRREEALKKLEGNPAGNSTLVNLKKREMIKQIRQENQKLIYDERYLKVVENEPGKL